MRYWDSSVALELRNARRQGIRPLTADEVAILREIAASLPRHPAGCPRNAVRSAIPAWIAAGLSRKAIQRKVQRRLAQIGDCGHRLEA